MTSESQRPSVLRVVIAITVTLLCMAVAWLGVSKYVEKRYSEKAYYPLGESGEVTRYTQHLSRGDAIIIGKRIQIVSFTEEVKRGGMASLEIKGDPYAVYSIEVHLKSGFSTSSALKPKEADADGTVRWEWRIGSRTTPGRFMVTVHRENKQNLNVTYAEMYIDIVENE